MAWSEYFTHPDTHIVGADIVPERITCPMDGPRVTIKICDVTTPFGVEQIQGNFDFIIDDGSHMVEHQMRSFKLLCGRLNEGGIYIIEDIRNLECVDMLKTLVEEMGFTAKLYDTRHIKGRSDDLMLVISKV